MAVMQRRHDLVLLLLGRVEAIDAADEVCDLFYEAVFQHLAIAVLLDIFYQCLASAAWSYCSSLCRRRWAT